MSAGDNEYIGALLGGVLSPVADLQNHTSTQGDTIDFGYVTAGESIVFIDYDTTSGDTWYSDTSLNSDGITHIYATTVTSDQQFAGSPAGTFVGFEDLPKGSSDYDYNDDTFIFQNVAIGAPELSTWAMMGFGFAGLAFAGFRTRKARVSIA